MPDADHHADVDTAAAHKQKKTHDTLAGCCMQEGSDNTKHIIITMWTEDRVLTAMFSCSTTIAMWAMWACFV